MTKRNFLRELFRNFQSKEQIAEGWSEVDTADREWEELYRGRWQYDKVARSTHGVNCTGSCSWRVYVKDGIIVWEHQATDYPTNGPDMPEYEPRGCSRGATFSWYVYSPLRVKYPYVRGELLRLWREALAKHGDPVEAWRSIVEDPEASRRYKSARGKGGFVRTSWDEALDIISAALVYTIKKYGPDRIFGFTPIPAMSMVSFSSGARFLELIGGVMLSFYDWYADLPAASPQVWGEQTDVHESADWYNSTYIIVWGTNLAMTRTPDAHFLSEARYNGTKVVVITTDYTDVTKFADLWVAPRPGTDGALAMSMVHVILKEFYVDRQVPYFVEYVKKYSDLPFLVVLEEEGDVYRPGRFLRASDLGLDIKNAEWKTVVLDASTGQLAVPNGSIGFRWSGEGRWNLKLEDSLTGRAIDPALTLLGLHDEVALVKTYYFDEGGPRPLVRGVPAKRLRTNKGELLVTTVYDLLLAHVGVNRGLPGDYPASYDDLKPFTPAWQEAITGVDRKIAIRVAREFAKNAELTRGKSMVIIGPGVNHWFHADLIYRAVISMLVLLGTVGVRGGGWAHYVGQEKVRPLDSWSHIAFALDWVRPARQQNTPSWVYIHADQYRYEDLPAGAIAVKAVYEHPVDYNVVAVKRGWLPFYPQLNANPIKLYEEAVRAGAKSDEEVVKYVKEKIARGELKFAVEDPDAPENFPRILFIWRANFLAASGKGHEYTLKHLLGADSSVMAKDGLIKPRELVWREPAPTGKLDLVVTLEFRMSTSALYSDIVLPAATWYEKYDLSTTDLHPFIHPFTPAIAPPWEARTDWDIFKALAKRFSELACKHLGKVKDVVVTPLLHDTPGEIAGAASEPRFSVVERDYCDVYHKFVTVGPLLRDSVAIKGLTWDLKEQYAELAKINGVDEHGHPLIEADKQAAEAILHLSSVTNGEVSYKAYKALSERTSLDLAHLGEEERGVVIHFDDIVAQPRRVLKSPVWSGKEGEGRTYVPFMLNVEDLVPWRTLTGRQHFYLDHEWFRDFGEELPTYKPPLSVYIKPFAPGEEPKVEGKALVLRYLTPHGKWQIHSTYMDNQIMLTLFRGGPVVWLNYKDAEEAGIKDNDWIEVFNRNGVIVARAVVTSRIPRGVAIMYHAQERTVNVGVSKLTGKPGGVHNSATRVRVKPTLMVGGYAQLSWAINYYGPTGTQRDEVVMVRRLGP